MEYDGPQGSAGPEAQAGEVRCAECGAALAAGDDREVTEGGVFCRPCFTALAEQVQHLVRMQGTGIDYTRALAGALLGAVLGVLVWWGFTVATKISFGLVAVVIGIAVGKGTTLFAGGKRSRGLQGLSVVVAGLAFFYASYLVNRTFLLRGAAEQGRTLELPLLPGPDLLFRIVSLGFGLFDLVFLAIVLFEAWRIPAPYKLGR